jgi:tight adherence protein C
MTQMQLLALGGFIILMSLAMFMIALSRRRTGVNIEERLAKFAEADRPFSVVDEELAASFTQRVLKPLFKKTILKLATFTPTRNIEKTKQKLAEAGNPSGLGVAEFMGLRLFLALALAGGGFLLFMLAGAAAGPLMILVAILGGFGYLMPAFWLGRKAKQRKKEIVRSMPDAIDLLTISVESGLGFDPALMRVAEKWDNALTREFARVLSEMRIGKARREALRELADRVNVDDLRVFISSVIQADQLGVAISQVLRIQSDAMRVRRRQRAEEAAHKAPIKMLIPMVFLIFPALYVVILGPAVPIVVEVFGGR